MPNDPLVPDSAHGRSQANRVVWRLWRKIESMDIITGIFMGIMYQLSRETCFYCHGKWIVNEYDERKRREYDTQRG